MRSPLGRCSSNPGISLALSADFILMFKRKGPGRILNERETAMVLEMTPRPLY
jgi:hypothetical protein